MVSKRTQTLLVNLITVLRIALALATFKYNTPEWLFFISIIAPLTDFVDGYWARRQQLETKIGATLDQLADKVFHLVVFWIYFQHNLIHDYFFYAFLARELFIIIFRYTGISAPTSSLLGKSKTFLAYTLIICLGAFHFFDSTYSTVLVLVFEILVLITAYYSFFMSLKPITKKTW
jgi:CDP-diacylglycerol--glycerol-3-phosphate 3-phosphatidyltransferase